MAGRLYPVDSNVLIGLVAAMLVRGVDRILTFNTKDFTRFKDIEAIQPLDVINQVPPA